MELYGFMEREKKIPSYFFIITKLSGRLDRNHSGLIGHHSEIKQQRIIHTD